MAGRRRKPKIYDERCYTNFGEQPSPLEIQLGYGLIPLVDTEPNNSPLLEDITYVRNQIDGEYGLPLPSVHVRDNMCLEPYEYKIFLHGVEVGGYEKCDPHYVMCIDTGYVTEVLDGEKIKDPAFGLDAIIIHESRKSKAQWNGYISPEWHVVIKNHLYEIIRNNITKFLNHCMVNTLVNKVRERNPDVVDDIFFMHDFSTSKLKIILNWLLDEGVSIRDMNTILETIADNLADTNKPVELMEKVREKLAYSIISNFADDKKIVHVLKIPHKLADILDEFLVYPTSNIDLPYFSLDSAIAKRFNSELNKKIKYMNDKEFQPVFITVSSLRTPFFKWLRLKFRGIYCISDLEVAEVYKDFEFSVEGELELYEDKDN